MRTRRGGKEQDTDRRSTCLSPDLRLAFSSGSKVPVKLNFRGDGSTETCISRNGIKGRKDKGDIKWQTESRATGATVQEVRYDEYGSAKKKEKPKQSIRGNYFLKVQQMWVKNHCTVCVH